MCFKVLASYHRPVPHQTLCIVCLGLSCLAPTCFAEGTVRDGLLDFVHVPGFSANAGGDSSFSSCGVQDLDAANLLIRANTLDLRRNQMTSLASGDSEGLQLTRRSDRARIGESSGSTRRRSTVRRAAGDRRARNINERITHGC